MALAIAAHASAQTGSCTPCPPAPSPTPNPTYANETFFTAPDGTPVKWDVYVPPSGGPQWPVAIVLHVGGFRAGGKGDAILHQVCHDLAAQGYVAISANYRLDTATPPGLSPTFFPNAKVGDVRAAIHAARLGTTPHTSGIVNGKVAAVAGSSGASHALFCSTTGRTSASSPAILEDRFDCAVLLSGAYDFDDADSLAFVNPITGDQDFQSGV